MAEAAEAAVAAEPCGAAEAQVPRVLPADLAALVFERLPPAEQCVTVSRLARAWRRWAASRVEPLAALLHHSVPWWSRHGRQFALQLPLWCVAEAWPLLSPAQRTVAGFRAAACGDVERLRWLRAQDPPCRWDEHMCSAAAGGGHLDALRLLQAQDPPCPWDWQTCSAAAEGGHLDVLRWVRAQDPPCPWDFVTCSMAAEGGHLDVLRWLRAQDPPCPWGEQMCTRVASRGRLDVLRWLRAQEPPCPWGTETCMAAAGAGHLDVLRWLRAQEPPCPWHRVVCMVVSTFPAPKDGEVAAWIATQASAARCAAHRA
jgi:hypothetical protein